ncbi:uncharacterized protein F5891DRAFT_1003602 [Suillus fuscotomentosus]|uniref:Uncharacterized protein n=1 Tax=Suillus fuscotomentosus TaxID=1912939 RepID=A0AAD4EKN4_9AGAM|nr:uncharacterized protein F5891DRAFT_1003602 [Suillus fuscotomentosus]KAG1906754.1 hypothetical protein F5891DRAFT_1003602 [Suillus fuscotomentosus]
MHSFLSHIRGRGIGNHSTAAPPLQPENCCIVPPTPALSYGVDSTIETSPAVRHGIDKRILENPSSYLDMADSESLPRSLTPRTRRHTVDVSNWGLRNILRAKPISESVCEVDKPGSDSPAHETTLSESKSIDHLAAPGDWSTFGRRRVRSSPIVPEFADVGPTKDTTRRTSHSPSLKRSNSNKSDEGLSSAESLHSIISSHSVPRSSIAHRDTLAQKSNRGCTLTTSVNNHTSSSSIHSKSSPTDIVSSRLHPRTPNRPRSNTSPTARPTAYFTTPILRELGFDSPGTFGHPTPESRSTFTFACASPPPPLPPLNHPALSSYLKDKNVNNITPTALGFASDRSNSFPKRSSRIPSGIGDDFFVSLSMKFGRSVRRSASLPKVQDVFPPSSEEQPAATAQRLRTRTISDKARLRRRNSASWSAQQATEGVNSSSNNAWPAEVSREMLRLSLGEGLDLVKWPSAQSGVPGPGSETRGSSVAQFPNQAPISRSFSPSPSPLRPRSPAPQGGERASQSPSPSPSSSPSPSPSANLPPPTHRPTSYVDPRMSANPNGTRVAPDGATSPNYTPSRLNVPVGPSKIQGRPSSQFLLPPSIAPTPARTSRTITMDPSTPTPTSRNHSDKIKGKRKAEDIDTTPPEQKKDVQRATFAVPESHRSQKLSASSHAPSSYHRKRARISSSPFGTPIHSRPVSTQSQSMNLEPTPEVGKFGSWSSRTSARILSSPSVPSHAASSTHSTRPQQTPNKNSLTNSITQNQNHARRQSMSQASIPISALVSPHAPSIVPSGKFHMRDPRRPPKKLAETPWTLHFRGEDEPGSPVHAWCFFVGFILFPVWWIAALFLRTPRTRVVGDEKGVSLDDPQIEHDAKAWRFRCRVMSVVSLFTYTPFIILVVFFVRR